MQFKKKEGKTVTKIAVNIAIFLFLLVSVMFVPSTVLAAQDGEYNVTSELWAKAVLQVPGNPVTLVWSEVGSDTTPSGAKVISGYFYADPNDFAYGSQYNPELFVKIYIDPSGWCNMAFNHVTVDDVVVSSAHNYSGLADQTETASLSGRLLEHEYTGVGVQTNANFDGSWIGTTRSTTATDNYGESCGSGSLSIVVTNNKITGTGIDWQGNHFDVTGSVESNGTLSARVLDSGYEVVTITGTVSGTTGSGSWNEYYGCEGNWSITKQ